MAAGGVHGWDRNGLATGKGLQELDLRVGIREGGQVQGFLVVARGDGEALEYAIYVRTSWTRGFRSLDKLVKLPPTFGCDAPITVYRQGCAELRRFKGILARDVSTAGAPDQTDPEGAATDPARAPPTD